MVGRGIPAFGLFPDAWRRRMLEGTETRHQVTEDVMKAQVGDRIIIAGRRVDDPVRDGEVLEVKGTDGSPPYTVRWSDGHTGLVYPGPGAVTKVESGTGQHGPTMATIGKTKPWHVQVSVVEAGDSTRATALLISDRHGQFSGHGDSHRSPRDQPMPEIGDEVAVARALRHLADTLLARAEADIEAATGTDAYVRPM
jgi:Domain of unknown function (DUF1876)/Domain of unknown function (DUF1918)